MMTRSRAGSKDSSRKGGHVFAVQGLIGQLSCDAVVVPTDADFTVERHWIDALRLAVEVDRPDAWGEASACRSQSVPAAYYVDVVPPVPEDAEWLGRQAVKVLELISEADVSASPGRVRPLVAIPVLGTGRGGFHQHVGEAIRAVLDAADSMCTSAEIDVVIVTPHDATFAALQHERQTKVSLRDVDPEVLRLAELARSGQLAVFIGAGASIPSGLPSWSKLLEMLGALVGPLPRRFNDLGDVDKAEYIQRQLLLRDQGSLGSRVVEMMIGDAQPALAHALLASLHFREAVTTNYDDLFERATTATGAGQKVVLPWAYPSQAEPWLLKLHGDIHRPDSIVLTRGSFVGFDSSSRPAGAVFQALLLTKHVLFVGVSMTDDNVLRLVLEASAYVDSQAGKSREIGTLLDVSNRPARKALWEDRLSWITMPGREVERARNMEIFLDQVVMHASRDSKWILDPSFEFLLDDDTRTSVRSFRSVVENSSSTDSSWMALVDAMRQFGLG